MRFRKKVNDLLWILTAFAPVFSLLTYGRNEYTSYAFPWLVERFNALLAPFGTVPQFAVIVASHVVLVFLLRCVVEFLLCLPNICMNFARKWGAKFED